LKDKSGLFVFVKDDEPPKFKCTVIVGHHGTENMYCNTPFTDEDQFVRHAVRCARAHEAEIMQAAPSQRLPGFYGPEAGIPDVERWLNAEDASGTSNRQKAIEGRRKL
jgi:hypothetical protein